MPRPALLLALLLGACAGRGHAPPTSPGGTAPASSAAPARDTFTVASAAVGEARPINVWTPRRYTTSASERFPVLYMPDGAVDEDFPHVVHAVDSLIAAGAIRPVIVVGIPNTQRRRDLTGPTRVKADSAIAPRVGGSAAFRRFIRDELISAVDARYRTTGERTIIGESLAGLFVLETFMEEPALFTHYVSLDPSLWWNDGALVRASASHLAAMPPAPRSLFLASANNGELTNAPATIAATLRAAPPAGLRWTYTPRLDLTHATIFRGTEMEALVHALGGSRETTRER